MKKNAFIVLAILWYSTAVAQEAPATADQIVFDRAIDLAQNGEKVVALSTFNDLLYRYPESPLAARTHLNIGYLQRMLNRTDDAIKTFNEILEMEYNELDSNNLMEPYQLYKHQSCRNLAEIYLEKGDYSQAESYIELFDKKFPYQHFCGNEWAAYDMYKARLLALVYEGEGKTTKAIRTLLPYLAESGLASNARLVGTLDEILRKRYSVDQLRAEFGRAIEDVKVVKSGKQHYAATTLFGEQIKFDSYYYGSADKTKSLADIKGQIMENQLFKQYASR